MFCQTIALGLIGMLDGQQTDVKPQADSLHKTIETSITKYQGLTLTVGPIKRDSASLRYGKRAVAYAA